ncbi:hypothetical protein PTTG_05292 [Puccinia triticina 1-1 BBBD Race 1]|uniref:Myb_DNA-bind_3 domain-containing protein n=1 Tax=Puccinia triticina (isolate 1-1 / race 1 (BBBD)) TaxID=630390 RepID=A0A180H2M6_PUCT1|nr:hypothetical protein PTTG_05292 [Puccinia triticina 1-1 BBBD Race 1]
MSQSPLESSPTRSMIQDILDGRNSDWDMRSMDSNDNSLDFDQPARPATPEEKPYIDHLNSPGTQESCKTEFDEIPDDMDEISDNATEDSLSSWAPTFIWTDEQQNALLEAVLQQQLSESRLNGNISSQGWTSVADRMREEFGCDFQLGSLKQELEQIRETYLNIKFLQNRFEFAWDEKKCIIHGAPSAWYQLIMENPTRQYSELQNRPGPIWWYPHAQRLFSTGPQSDRRQNVFFDDDKVKMENMPNNLAHSPIASSSANPTRPVTSKRKNGTIPSYDHEALAHADPTCASTSRAVKHRRLSDHNRTVKKDWYSASQTVPANAFEKRLQLSPVIKTEDSRPDPPMNAEDSTKNEPTLFNRVANVVRMALTSSSSRAEHNPVASSGCAEEKAPFTSGSESFTTLFGAQKNNKRIQSTDRGNFPHMASLPSGSEAKKQPRLSNHDLFKKNDDSTSLTTPAKAPKKIIQPTPITKSDDIRRDPPMKAEDSGKPSVTERKSEPPSSNLPANTSKQTFHRPPLVNNEPDSPLKAEESTKPGVTERKSKPTSSNRVDKEAGMLPSSSTATAQHPPAESSRRGERAQRPVTNNAPGRETVRQEEDHRRSSNPTIRAIAVMAPMFFNRVSPLEYVQFVQVVENHTNAEIFLALASTTDPITCRTWLQQKLRNL